MKKTLKYIIEMPLALLLSAAIGLGIAVIGSLCAIIGGFIAWLYISWLALFPGEKAEDKLESLKTLMTTLKKEEKR